MSKRALVLVLLVVCPLVLGTQFYVLEGKVFEFEIRAGQRMKCWGDVINDPCEPIPYTFKVVGQGPDGLVWELPTEPNIASKWGFEWQPTEAQVGVHDVRIVAIEDPIESTVAVENSGSVRITVHPAKRKPVFRLGGCAILSGNTDNDEDPVASVSRRQRTPIEHTSTVIDNL